MALDQQLSSRARERMDAMLPDLLGAVRRRRRRRQVVRASVVLATVGVLLLQLWSTPAVVAPIAKPADVPATCAWEIVHDLPGIKQRLRGEATQYQNWMVGDEELQAFLREAHRPEGIVRIAGKASVAKSVVDPWPASAED